MEFSVNSILLRPMQIGDLEQVLTIQEELGFQNWKMSHFLSELSHPERSFCWVATENIGNIVAYLVLVVLADEAEILTVATAKKFQRQGIAKTLIQEVWNEIAKNPAVSLQMTRLEVRLSNLGAIELYQKLGFKQDWIRKGYYPDGEDALLMVKFHGAV